MGRRHAIAALLFNLGATLYCQTSAYQDANGDTSIYIANAKADATFNVSDSKFSVGYLYEPSAVRLANVADLQKALAAATSQTERDTLNAQIKTLKTARNCTNCIYGAEFSGKPTTDLTNQIFQSSNSPASVTGGGSFGVHGVFAPGIFQQTPNGHLRDDWFLTNATYTRSTFDTVASSSATPVAQHFNGFSLMPTYNALLSIPGFSFLAGVSAGINRTNNSGNLKKVSIDTTEATSGSVTVVSESDAYLGTYRTSIGAPIYSDFVFIPKTVDWLAFDAFERANVVPTNGYAEGGFGIFFAQPAKPTAVLGGLSVGWKNGDRTVAIVAGWSF
jgi:hypothetical protein